MMEQHEKWLKMAADYVPLIGFFILYQFEGLRVATGFLVVASLVATFILYVMTRKIAWVALLSAFFIGVFGGLTLWFDDPVFIKMKPSLLNILFAILLLGGLARNKLFLKQLLQHGLTLPDSAWRILTLRYVGLFIGLAILNEWAWRIMGEAFWVAFKLFGLLGLTLLFTLAQARFILRHQQETDK